MFLLINIFYQPCSRFLFIFPTSLLTRHQLETVAGFQVGLPTYNHHLSRQHGHFYFFFAILILNVFLFALSACERSEMKTWKFSYRVYLLILITLWQFFIGIHNWWDTLCIHPVKQNSFPSVWLCICHWDLNSWRFLAFLINRSRIGQIIWYVMHVT